ncbi:hypothetical protein lbkm_1505 [Lachnospiraceae bacterium KM106-2]|nr:hypothetical protein lbkm_1505 [Lachnospiraceae bacterium KM106-2]
MKEKTTLYVLLSCLFVITVLGIGCFSFYQYIDIKEPVFLSNYVENNMPDGYSEGMNNLLLQYITRTEDERVLREVSFPEYPGLECYPSGDDWNLEQSLFGYQTMQQGFRDRYKKVQVSLGFNPKIKKYLKQEIVLHKAVVTYHDGTTQKVDLGTIIFYPFRKESNVLKQTRGYGEEYTEDEWYRIQKDFKLLKITSALRDEDHNEFEYRLDGKAIRLEESINKQYKASENDDGLYFTMKLTSEKGKYDIYAVHPVALIENSKGKKEEIELCWYQYERPLFNEEHFIQYLYERKKEK